MSRPPEVLHGAKAALAFAHCDPMQSHFHRRWHGLRDTHVRALAALLTAPDLLDRCAAAWGGKIATLAGLNGASGDDGLTAWLHALDRDPAALHAVFNGKTYTRLGLYAEKLMAFYFAQHAMLEAHGVQVRAGKNDTVGEFDFLLHTRQGLVHIELASKFYLYEGGDPVGTALDRFVGPNLADSLGAKMTKILDSQLSLGRHPAAQAHLPQALSATLAMVKGWLFYRGGYLAAPTIDGIAADHARGFWCELPQFEAALAGETAGLVMPKLQWLAPLQMADQPGSIAQLHRSLSGHFERDATPLLVAAMREEEGVWVETRRGFVVPEGWTRRAQAFIDRGRQSRDRSVVSA